MSFFKKVLSSVGIGSAKVDTIIDTVQASPGEMIHGHVLVNGGKVEQEINHISIDVCCHYFSEETYTEEDDEGEEREYTRRVRHNATLRSFKICNAFTTEVGKSKQFEFDIELPLYTPLSFGDSHVWLRTNLDIASAIDKSDKDTVEVLPTARQQQLFDAMSELGFTLREVECEEGRQFGQPFVQEFEFKPQHGEFRGRVDEVEFLMVSHPERLELLVEIDRRSRGFKGFFSEVLGRDETKLWLDIGELEQTELVKLLHHAIDDNC